MRVVIAEDLALLRDGIVRLLRDNGMEVAAAVEDGDALVRAVERERPDVAVVDVRLPPSFRDEGLRAALEARRRVPGTAVLVVSQYVEQTYAVADREQDYWDDRQLVRQMLYQLMHDPLKHSVA